MRWGLPHRQIAQASVQPRRRGHDQGRRRVRRDRRGHAGRHLAPRGLGSLRLRRQGHRGPGQPARVRDPVLQKPGRFGPGGRAARAPRAGLHGAGLPAHGRGQAPEDGHAQSRNPRDQQDHSGPWRRLDRHQRRPGRGRRRLLRGPRGKGSGPGRQGGQPLQDVPAGLSLP